MDGADRFRPRSGACFRCFHLRLSGETSQLGLHAPAGALPPNPVRIPLRFGCIRTFSRKVGTPHSRDRCPCATGLASYPSSCLSSHPDDALFGASRSIRILLRLCGHRRSFLPAPPAGNPQSAAIRLLFPHPVATPGGCSGHFFDSSRTAGWRTSTLAHSSNYRLSPTVFTPGPETPEQGA
jgi:hypothetical protein